MMSSASKSSRSFCVTVYGSSSSKVSEVFKSAARDLGRAIAAEGWVQLNGGGRTGLMGAATEGGKEANGVVNCCILSVFVDKNMHSMHDDAVVAHTVPERKTGLYDPADAFVALPGGLGTLEELAEVMSWRQLSLHERPIVLMNTEGYWDSLVNFIKDGQKKGFISKNFHRSICVASSSQEAISLIKDFKPIPINKEQIHASGPKADWTEAAVNEYDHGGK